MPKCIYVLLKDSKDGFLNSETDAPPDIPDGDWADVIAIEPTNATWTYTTSDGAHKVTIDRRQFPLLLHKVSTLHAVQGKTTKPGLAAHWKFPKALGTKALWLAHYVILSRPTSLSNLISYGLPDREILEAGPPQEIQDVFDRLFGAKIKKTQEAAIEARRALGWPPRR